MFGQANKSNLMARLAKGRPYSENLHNAAEGLINLTDGFAVKAAEIRNDRKLSREGQDLALAELARKAIPDLAKLTRGARKAIAFAQGEIAGLSSPKPDPTDLRAEMRRAEIRTYLRSLPEAKRFQAALAMAKVPDQALAILDAPSDMSGLSETLAEQVRDTFLEATHGAKLADLRATADDYTEVLQIGHISRMRLQNASAMPAHVFQAALTAAEQEADR